MVNIVCKLHLIRRQFPRRLLLALLQPQEPDTTQCAVHFIVYAGTCLQELVQLPSGTCKYRRPRLVGCSLADLGPSSNTCERRSTSLCVTYCRQTRCCASCWDIYLQEPVNVVDSVMIIVHLVTYDRLETLASDVLPLRNILQLHNNFEVEQQQQQQEKQQQLLRLLLQQQRQDQLRLLRLLLL